MTSVQRRWALIAVASATFMTYLDNSIVNVALPSIQRDLGLSVPTLEWVVSSYILVFGSCLLASGRLADIYGTRRLFLIGLSVFTVASLLAGLASTAPELIASRALQGLGAAMVTPSTLAIISAMYSTDRQRRSAIGIWNAVGAVALALGPLFGGIICQHLTWDWIFFINVPFGAATIALAVWSIHLPATPRARIRLDFGGLISSGCALYALTYAFIEGGLLGWTSPLILGCFAGAIMSGTVFVVIESRAADPMIAVSLFRDRVFGGGMVATFIWAFGIFGIFFFTSLYLQDVLKFSPTLTGTAFVPMALLMVAGSVLSDRAARRFGAHRSVAAAMGLIAVGIGGAALLGAHANFVEVASALVIIGVGGGFTTSLTASILVAMPSTRAAVPSAIFSTVRQLGALLGIVSIGAILTAREGAALRAGQSAGSAFITGYHTALIVAAALVAAGAVAANLALRRAPSQPDAAGPAPVRPTASLLPGAGK